MDVAGDESEQRTTSHAQALAFIHLSHVGLDTVDAAERIRDDSDRESDRNSEEDSCDGLQFGHEDARASASVDAPTKHVRRIFGRATKSILITGHVLPVVEVIVTLEHSGPRCDLCLLTRLSLTF